MLILAAEEAIGAAGRLLSGPCRRPMPCGQPREGRAHAWCHGEFTLFTPASCQRWWPFSPDLFWGKETRSFARLASALHYSSFLHVQSRNRAVTRETHPEPRVGRGEAGSGAGARLATAEAQGQAGKWATAHVCCCSSVPAALGPGWGVLVGSAPLCPHHRLRLDVGGLG